MSHWAEIDENNIVIRVVVGNNDDLNEGYDWLIENLGGTWIKTSYNCYAGKRYEIKETEKIGEDGSIKIVKEKIVSEIPHFRYNFAGVGYKYNEIADAFIPPMPEEIQGFTWILNTESYIWESIENIQDPNTN